MEETMTNAPAAEAATVATLPVAQARQQRDIRVVTDTVPILDTARFEHMQRIANVMAQCDLIPKALKGKDQPATMANCFLVVNQSVRWGMDPFAVAQCASVIQGKLCYEGKLVAAVMQKYGVNLEFAFNGKEGDALGVTVRGTLPGETRPREISGTVGQWKTTNEQWKKDPAAMLCYRGARAWSRIHNPAPMLGVYTPDEIEELGEDVRATRARDVSPPPIPRVAADAPAKPAHDPETGEVWADPPAEAASEAPAEATASSDPPPIPSDDDLSPFDNEDWLKQLEGKFGGCQGFMSLHEAQGTHMAPYKGKATPAAWKQAEALVTKHLRRINTDVGG